MDVFIPEEYVIRRRIEKKAAKRPPDKKASSRMEKEERKTTELQPPFRLNGGEFLVSGGISETVVFSCLSA
ncbi:Nuclear transcription factor Y subunit C-9 [Hibiscus syriacus]|uniref:Nuclear transcription factor Y subunit C-9 n=1 Tax=Hibiscus syriacus TaxID=106335 RepID=A0A6A3C387_HIBSY|nr:Nuclear transcription factor Y subunit C-9 [Hibiscus syriacus]